MLACINWEYYTWNWVGIKLERSEAKPVWDKQNILDSNKTERDPVFRHRRELQEEFEMAQT